MLNAIVLGIRFLFLVFCGHRQVALENAALRQQLAVFKRNGQRPRLHRRDRLFWIALRMFWRNWKSALVIVRPETVISWQHKRFKRYWPRKFTEDPLCGVQEPSERSRHTCGTSLESSMLRMIGGRRLLVELPDAVGGILIFEPKNAGALKFD